MLTKLVVVFVVKPLDGGFLDGSVHAFDLAVRPGVVDLREPVLGAIFTADTVKNVLTSMTIFLAVCELDAVVGQDSVDVVRDGLDEVAQELGRNHFPGPFMQLHIGELRSPVDCDEQPEFSFLCAHFGNVHMKVSDRIALELLPGRFVAVHLWQAADPVALQAAVQ